MSKKIIFSKEAEREQFSKEFVTSLSKIFFEN